MCVYHAVVVLGGGVVWGVGAVELCVYIDMDVCDERDMYGFCVVHIYIHSIRVCVCVHMCACVYNQI